MPRPRTCGFPPTAVPVPDPDPEKIVLQATGVHKSYGQRQALAGVDLQVAAGECVGMLGPNGAGKTTFLRICLGTVAADRGEVRAFGLRLPGQALAARARIGVVPQDSWLDPDFNCLDNLLVYASYFGIDGKTAAAAAPKLLEFAGIPERSREPVLNLSGGLKRRLALARSLINDPEMIFLDEPTTALDPAARHLIWERLRRLRSQGRALLLTTHFMEEAERLCDRVLIVDSGRVLAEGAPEQLIAANVEREVLEVSGPGFESWLAGQPDTAARVVALGDLHYCYADDGSRLAAAAGREGKYAITRRPAGLEDVYLRLTGHSLRDL